MPRQQAVAVVRGPFDAGSVYPYHARAASYEGLHKLHRKDWIILKVTRPSRVFRPACIKEDDAREPRREYLRADLFFLSGVEAACPPAAPFERNLLCGFSGFRKMKRRVEVRSRVCGTSDKSFIPAVFRETLPAGDFYLRVARKWAKIF